MDLYDIVMCVLAWAGSWSEQSYIIGGWRQTGLVAMDHMR